MIVSAQNCTSCSRKAVGLNSPALRFPVEKVNLCSVAWKSSPSTRWVAHNIEHNCYNGIDCCVNDNGLAILSIVKNNDNNPK